MSHSQRTNPVHVGSRAPARRCGWPRRAHEPQGVRGGARTGSPPRAGRPPPRHTPRKPRNLRIVSAIGDKLVWMPGTGGPRVIRTYSTYRKAWLGDSWRCAADEARPTADAAERRRGMGAATGPGRVRSGARSHKVAQFAFAARSGGQTRRVVRTAGPGILRSSHDDECPARNVSPRLAGHRRTAHAGPVSNEHPQFSNWAVCCPGNPPTAAAPGTSRDLAVHPRVAHEHTLGLEVGDAH